MKVKVNTRHEGRPGASFRIELAGEELPYGLSVRGLQNLIIEAHRALDAHQKIAAQRER